RQAEHHFDTLHLEGFDQGLGPCELHVVDTPLPSLANWPEKSNGPPDGRPRCTQMWACIYMSTTTIAMIPARMNRSVPRLAADAQPRERDNPAVTARRKITDAQRRARLATRHRLLATARTDDVAAIADSVVALHSTDPATVYLSAMARMKHPSIEAVSKAIY